MEGGGFLYHPKEAPFLAFTLKAAVCGGDEIGARETRLQMRTPYLKRGDGKKRQRSQNTMEGSQRAKNRAI